MTTDDFTEAARAEAEDYARAPRMNVGTVRDRLAEAHLAGAEWGREQALTQEPTDAEVEAAARALAYWDGADRWATPEYDGEIPESAYRHGARKALSAARAARRDGEKRDD